MKLRNINWYGFFLHCVIIILSVLVVRLTVQNNSLANKLKSISVERIKKGEVLSSLVLEDLNKRKVNISSLNHEYKVVFVFSTTCNFCKSSIPVINQINTSCPNEVSVIGLSNDNIDETKEFLISNKAQFQVFLPATENYLRDNKITGFPFTLLIDSSGRVNNVWVGQLTEIRGTEIINYIKNEMLGCSD